MHALAKLFLRGKLIKKTAKNLTNDEKKEVEKYCDLIWQEPDLAHTKTVFCSKLSWMVGGDYQDLEVAMQEVWIVYWKTTVDILFHRPKKEIAELIQATCAKCKSIKIIKCNACYGSGTFEGSKCTSCYGRGFSKTDAMATCSCGASATLCLDADVFSMSYLEAKKYYEKTTGKPAPERDMSILSNPIQRRKFYKTTLWTYFKQVINENKPKTHKVSSTIKEYAEKAAVTVILEIIGDSYKIKNESSMNSWIKPDNHNNVEIEFDTNLLSLEGVMKLRDLQDSMIAHNVEIGLSHNLISVKKVGTTNMIVVDVKKSARVNYLSIYQPDDEASGTYLYPNAFVEAIAPPESPSEMEQLDGLLGVRRHLDEVSKKIFDLIISPPNDYAEKYSINPVRRSNVSKYLNISKSEVDAVWEKIKKATIKAGLR